MITHEGIMSVVDMRKDLFPNQPIAIIMVGLPGSGKSTYRAKFMEEFPVFTEVSSDDYIEDWGVKYGNYLTYTDAFPHLIDEAMKYTNHLVDNCINDKYDVLIDQTNLSAKKRSARIKQFKDAGYYVMALVFVINEEKQDIRLTTQERAGKVIPKNVLTSMRESFKIPDYSEGWDFILCMMQ
jgi:predicted ABC-type ATPase